MFKRKNKRLNDILNSIASEDSETGNGLDVQDTGNLENPGYPPGWNGEYNEDNIYEIYDLDRNDPVDKAFAAAVFTYWSTFLDEESANRCADAIRKSKFYREWRDAKKLLGEARRGGDETKIAKAFVKYNESVVNLYNDTKGPCNNGGKQKFINIIIAKVIIGMEPSRVRDLENALADHRAFHARFGTHLYLSGQQSLAAHYATAVAFSEGGGGSTCSIDHQTGEVSTTDQMWVVLGGVGLIVLLRHPLPAALIAAFVAACAYGDSIEFSQTVARARKLMDNYRGIAEVTPSEEEQYIDEVVDPTGLSNVDDFDPGL